MIYGGEPWRCEGSISTRGVLETTNKGRDTSGGQFNMLGLALRPTSHDIEEVAWYFFDFWVTGSHSLIENRGEVLTQDAVDAGTLNDKALVDREIEEYMELIVARIIWRDDKGGTAEVE